MQAQGAQLPESRHGAQGTDTPARAWCQPFPCPTHRGSAICCFLSQTPASQTSSILQVQQLLALNTQITAQPRPGEPVSCVVVKGAGGKVGGRRKAHGGNPGEFACGGKGINKAQPVSTLFIHHLRAPFLHSNPVPARCLQAFCAGGDVKELVVRALARNAAGASASGPDPAAFGVAFFRTEYANNAAISQLPVPYVALIDGICMGGGVGASFHGAFRVATERWVPAA